MSFNKITIVGNLGRDPELRYTPQGDAVCNFSVAVNEKKRDKAGEMQDITTWFRVTLWRRQAENASKYLTKGSPIYIEGRLHVEEWTDRDGNNRYTLEVSATDMQFLGGRAGDSEASNEAAYSGSAPVPSNPTPTPAPAGGTGNDDIPF
ncbi:MAG: single-stranded DNA-binding protein [Acidobacteria bacterium]|nr:single-stranded DNA-binding protein [Acidobacteriota bacterium]MBK8150672.1 single-stranded DNA-binding protein [Acidobacteriota bacterium]